METPTFEKAKESPELRQPYCTSLEQRLPKGTKIVHDPRAELFNSYIHALANDCYINKEQIPLFTIKHPDDAPLFLVFPVTQLIGKGKPQTVFAFDCIFQKREPYIIHTLEDHEVVHIMDNMEGILLSPSLRIDYTNAHLLQMQTLVTLGEVRAYRNQILQAKNKGLDKKVVVVDALDLFLDFEYERLAKITPANKFEEEVIAMAR